MAGAGPAPMDPSNDSDEPPAAKKTGDLEAALAPHSDVVRIAKNRERQSVLCHLITLERVVLPGEASWSLTFDGDGFGACTAPGAGPLLVEDLLKLQLYESDGHMLILDRSGPKQKLWSMTERLRQYQSGSAVWSHGVAGEASLAMCVVAVPRGGCRLFFSAPDLYRALGLSSYKGSPSKWSYESAPAWRSFMQTMGFQDWLLHSPAGEKINDALNSTTHFLPWLSVSTVALVAILVRSTHKIPQKGGLCTVELRLHCEAVLKGLVLSVAGDIETLTAWRLSITWLYTWSCSWPLPETFVADLYLQVSAEGVVDLGPWVDAAKQLSARNMSPVRKWYELVNHFGRQCTVAQLLMAVGHAPAEARATGLLGQLLMQVASRVEKFAEQTAKGKVGLGDKPLSVTLHDAGDMVQTPRDTDILLIRHVESSRHMLQHQMQVSLSTDKASVKGLSLVNSVIATTSGVACVCPPQVDESFQPSPESSVATTAAQKAEVASEQNARHQVWIERSRNSGSGSTSFKPKKVYRQSAVKICRYLDNQVRVMMASTGLRRFRFDEESELWKDASLWPHITITSDRGSDNHSGIYALMHKENIQVNMSVWWDPSHDGWRSVMEAVRGVGMFGFVILIMIAVNLSHGPDGTDMRFGQLRKAAEELFRVHSPGSCKLFSTYLRELMQEVGSALPAVEGQTAEQNLWSFLEAAALFRPKGYRANLNRFQSVIREGQALLEKWYASLFVTEFAALELGMLTPAALKAKVRLASSGADDGAPTGATSAIQVDDRVIRNAAQNAVVITVLTLQEKKHHRLLSIIVSCSSPVERWHHHQNVELRDSERAANWAVSQVVSEYTAHVFAVLSVPGQEGPITQCGFAKPGGEGSSFVWNEEETMSEDDYASLMGSFAMQLSLARLRRFVCSLSSWPWGMLRVLGEGVDESAVVSQFKEHYDDFVRFSSLQGPVKEVKELLKRSVFQTMSTKQLVAVCAASEWQPSQQLKSVMMSRVSGLLGTQIVEDLNNVQKNDRSLCGHNSAGSQHYRRPETSFCAGIVRGVVDKVHRFSKPELKTAVVRRSASLEQSVFKPSHSSLPFQTISSGKQQADWWSPSPANSGTTAADHALCRAAIQSGNLSSIKDAWLGCWCHVGHQICCQFAGDDDDAWWVTMCHFDRSACLFWKVALKEDSFTGGHVELVFLPMSEPKLISVTKLEGIRSFTFVWKSWAWQRAFAVPGLTPAVRPVRLANTTVGPIASTCARNAFFTMTKSRILDIMEYLNHEKPTGDSLFDVCFAASKAILGAPDTEIMQLMKLRFSKLPCHTEYLGDLLQVDEAQACLDESDRSELKRLEQSAFEHATERSAFVTAFRTQRERMGNATTSGGAKRSKTSPVSQFKGPRKLPEPGKNQLLQKDLRVYVPPGGRIWVARSKRAWCTRLPPLNEYAAYWKHYASEEEAARAALAHLWAQWLETEGLPLSDCPITNLSLSSSVSASSSSSS